jgi:YebC/PmpR family DNA-binding regulatory protein
MGRAFEFRKERKFKRWDKMSKVFTRLGKEIVMAVKAGGPDPSSNAKLRTVIQNAKGAQMPKDRIEGAIKRASNKDEKDYEEVVYEGYGPFGVPFIVETSTDNTNRTVANVRSYFAKAGGSLGTSGSVSFMFERKAVFRFAKAAYDLEELELEFCLHRIRRFWIDAKSIGRPKHRGDFCRFPTLPNHAHRVDRRAGRVDQ